MEVCVRRLDPVRHAISILGLVSLSCSSPSESRQPSATPRSDDGNPSQHAAAAGPSDAAPTVARAGQPAVDPSACAADADCAFDNPCNPERCVAAATVPASAGCDRSRPPTGACVCLEKRCSLRPGPNHPVVAVDADCDHVPGCALDRAAGRCAPGRDDDFRPNRSIGPRCDCDSRVPRRCRFSWLDPIACTSVDDCWVDPAPFSHPIARPRAKKGKRFRPCKDGEVAPACTEGRCDLLAYGC
jgi:hypothetical protein